MNENTKTIIRYRLKRARECLMDANSLFNSESLHSTVNRIYYAMYYSINALLLTKNLSIIFVSEAESAALLILSSGIEIIDKIYQRG